MNTHIIIPVLWNLLRSLLLLLCLSLGSVKADIIVVPDDITVVAATESAPTNEATVLPVDEVPEQKSTALAAPAISETSSERVDLNEVKVNEPMAATEAKIDKPVATTETKVSEPVLTTETKVETPVAATETKVETKQEADTKQVAPAEETEGESFEAVPVEMAANDANVAISSTPAEHIKDVEVIKETVVRTPNAEIVGGSAPLFR
jgi:hypothetical protein